MLQFLTYLLYKQIIEMRRSQNLRRPLSVPCPTQCMYIVLVSNIAIATQQPVLPPSHATNHASIKRSARKNEVIIL